MHLEIFKKGERGNGEKEIGIITETNGANKSKEKNWLDKKKIYFFDEKKKKVVL